MAKPTQLPQWADGGSADVVEPSAGKKTLGWILEKPPFQYFNWLFLTIYLWCFYLKAGIMSGDGVGDSTVHDPAFGWTDREGAVQSFIDQNGLRGGSAFEINGTWSTIGFSGGSSKFDLQVPGTQFFGTSEPNASVTTDQANGVFASYGVEASCNVVVLKSLDAAVNTDGTAYIESGIAFADHDNAVRIMEARVALGAVGSSEMVYSFGFHESPGASDTNFPSAAAQSFVMFELASGDTNWQCRTGNGTSGTDSDSGVAAAANTWTHLRVEYFGLNTDVAGGGGAAVARFYIDGVHVASVSTNVPKDSDTGNLYAVVRVDATSTGPSGDQELVLAPLRVAWQDASSPTPPVSP